ncbi:polysaccharide biosynthesis C-terminal domain-containing protein [Clostridium sp.]|uniref:lipopolysaccharide biosynthesis protein n=1 Tax=Clostridium sp. TaxID=1506 RepID=UPI003216DE7D
MARAALYKPLSERDNKSISIVVYEIKHFFRIVGFVFCIYVVVLALSFGSLSHIECFDKVTTFLLVVVISISTFAQYFVGISYSVLLQAAQKTYITQIASSITIVLNAILIILLVMLNSNIIVVKLISSLVFVIKPFILWMYVKKEFDLVEVTKRKPELLEQKWTGLGQHIAFFLHSNTDIAVLTILTNLKYVAVYSVYNMIISQIQNFTTSFSTGMEALFGDMLAQKEIVELHDTFDLYEGIISFVAGVFFSVTAVMIIPFVRIYTYGLNDANYIYPFFGFVLVIASYVFCLRMPYHSMTIAAGCFKETKFAAYGEALINISLSIILVSKFGLIGVAIGTFVAVVFRTFYYVYYLSHNVFNRKIRKFFKRTLTNIVSFGIVMLIGNVVLKNIDIRNYVQWAVAACIVSMVSLVIQLIIMKLFYKELQHKIFRFLFRVR